MSQGPSGGSTLPVPPVPPVPPVVGDPPTPAPPEFVLSVVAPPLPPVRVLVDPPLLVEPPPPLVSSALLQVPPEQVWSPVHTLSHSPQWEVLVMVSTHWPSHTTSLPGHLHSPATHPAPVGQAELQPPQCAALVCVSTQLLSQLVSPCSQLVPQV